MSNDKIYHNADLGDKGGLQIGLFDRIINIKFTRADNSTFTLRSDYEPVWLGDRLFFKPCQPKPDIRVQYTQYQGVLINVDIFVTNLNIIENSPVDIKVLSSDITAVTSPQIQGEFTNFSNDSLTRKGNKQIKKAEIEMGYRGQLPDWSKYDGSVSPAVAYTAFQNLEEMQWVNLTDQNNRASAAELANDQIMFQEYRRCSIIIEWAVNTTNPPDKITQFHGYAGAPDAGFAPFAFQTLGDPSTASAGTEAILTKDDIMKELNDRSLPIDKVSAEEEDSWAALSDTENGVYRNLFNGGKGFTLLEGYCFHTLTRRFVKSNIKAKRNALLEQAALEYTLQAKSNTDTLTDVKELQSAVLQQLYTQERAANEDCFIDDVDKNGNNIIKLTEKASVSFEKALNERALEILAEQSIGPRFTIRNLPEYRQLYSAIRNKLAEAYLKKEYTSWWAAAASIGKSSEAKFLPQASIDETIEDIRNYTLDLQNGQFDDSDCYFDNLLLGKEWIIPMQTMVNSISAKNHRGLPLQIKAPTKVTSSGYTTPGEAQDVKCFSGLFEVRDAYMFGVPVLCSDAASAIFKNYHADKSTVQTQFFSDSQSQIDWICKTWSLHCYRLHNGGYYLYSPRENGRVAASQTFVLEQSKKPFRIPAIYDMTLSPLRKIRMPFIAFLDPMRLVEWNSSSMLGEMVSFYYQPEKGKNFFLIIKSTIDFATVSNFNTMEIELVDAPAATTPKIEPALIEKNSSNKGFYRDVIIVPDGTMDSWRKIHDSSVTTIPIGLLPLWNDPEATGDHKITEDNKVSNFQFFLQMFNWNNTLFMEAAANKEGSPWDDSNQRTDSEADSLYGRTKPTIEVTGLPTDAVAHFPKIPYCMTKLTDPTLKRIYMRLPIMPDSAYYNDMKNVDDKRVVVYQNGSWYECLKSEISEFLIEAK